ncbi:hypothetical protein [Arachnia propionica]|uniref:hypothetical protein n=1 Tax=Arachnia propionica TaxID=1750 RepID=UPI0016395C85|nr:hypothetical protein [Arachnia propionica]
MSSTNSDTESENIHEIAPEELDELLDRVHAELTATGGPLDFDPLHDPDTGLPR